MRKQKQTSLKIYEKAPIDFREKGFRLDIPRNTMFINVWRFSVLLGKFQDNR